MEILTIKVEKEGKDEHVKYQEILVLGGRIRHETHMSNTIFVKRRRH